MADVRKNEITHAGKEPLLINIKSSFVGDCERRRMMRITQAQNPADA